MQFIKHGLTTASLQSHVSTITHETRAFFTKDASHKDSHHKAVHSILQRPLLSSPSTPLVGRCKVKKCEINSTPRLLTSTTTWTWASPQSTLCSLGHRYRRTEEEIELRKRWQTHTRLSFSRKGLQAATLSPIKEA